MKFHTVAVSSFFALIPILLGIAYGAGSYFALILLSFLGFPAISFLVFLCDILAIDIGSSNSIVPFVLATSFQFFAIGLAWGWVIEKIKRRRK